MVAAVSVMVLDCLLIPHPDRVLGADLVWLEIIHQKSVSGVLTVRAGSRSLPLHSLLTTRDAALLWDTAGQTTSLPKPTRSGVPTTQILKTPLTILLSGMLQNLLFLLNNTPRTPILTVLAERTVEVRRS